jgi:hypothetical protein
MSKYTIGMFFRDVEKFNRIADNLSDITPEKVNNQISVNYEEAVDIITGFEEKDAVELLDGVVDNLFTCMGLLQQLEVAGFNTEKALKKVAANNLSKFPTDKFPTIPVPEQAVEEGWQLVHNKQEGVLIWKDTNGKIRKPHGYQSVNLSDCVPEKGFFNE